MPIKVKCPNDKCGKVLEMPDQFAGKKGKCPVCGAMFMIPNPALRRDVAVGRVVEEQPIPSPSAAGREPERAFADASQGLSRLKKKKFRSRPATDSAALTTGGVGIALLILLALTPVMPWMYASSSVSGGQTVSNSGSLSGWNSADGKVIFGVSLGVAGLAGLCLVLTAVSGMPRDAGDILFGTGMSAAAAWGSVTSLWFIGIIWKFLVLSSEFSGLESMARQAGGSMSIGVYPHIGVILGLLAGISVATLFSLAAVRRLRPEFLLIAHGVGIITGVLILVLYLEPWTAGRSGFAPSMPRTQPFRF